MPIGSLRRFTMGCVVALSALACGGRDTASTDKASTEGGCAAASRKVDGGCCPPGKVVHSGSCTAVGPLSCSGDAAAATSDKSCTPRWCATWQRADGSPCSHADPDCLPVRIDCPAPTQGCTAGSWPDGEGNCLAAGLAGSTTAVAAEGPLTAPAGVPAMDDVPAEGMPPLCAAADGKLRWCGVGETPPCGPAQLPDPRTAGSCIDTGVPWLCPAGFASSGAVDPASGLAGCSPIASDCGSDPFGGVAEGPGVVFVAAGAGAAGLGSRDKPYATISAALAAAPAGGTVAIAAGDYGESISLEKPVQLVGRCASMVRIHGLADKATIKVIGAAGSASTIRGVHVDEAPQGIFLDAPRKLTLQRVWVTGSTGAAVVARGQGAQLDVEQSVVDDTRSGLGGPGVGMAAVDGARLNAIDVRVRRTASSGVAAAQKPSLLTAERLLVDTVEGDKPSSAILADGGGRVELRGARVVASTSAGILVRNKSVLEGYGVSVEKTRVEPASKLLGNGLLVASGAKALVQGARLTANRTAGIGITQGGSRIEAHGLLVDGTLPEEASGRYGAGMMAGAGAEAIVASARFTGNHEAALLVTGEGTLLRADGLLVDHTQPRPLQLVMGLGLALGEGARCELRRSRFSGNHATGVSAIQAGTELFADDMLVDHTMAQPGNKRGGMGLVAIDGAKVHVHRSRLTANRGAGITIERGAALDLTASVVDSTESLVHTNRHGLGLQVASGSQATVSGCHFRANRHCGVLVVDEGTLATVTGSLVEDTRLDAGLASLGMGIAIAKNVAALDLNDSLVRNNLSAGVYADHAPLRIRNSAVLASLGATLRVVNPDGQYGDKITVGDGVVAIESPLVEIQSTLLGNHVRAGLLLDRVEQVLIGSSGIHGNYFGVVTLGATSLVESLLAIWDNSQDRATPSGLSVPPPPEAADTAEAAPLP
jgi:hypothetical protein